MNKMIYANIIIMVHDCRTQYSTEQFGLFSFFTPKQSLKL